MRRGWVSRDASRGYGEKVGDFREMEGAERFRKRMARGRRREEVR